MSIYKIIIGKDMANQNKNTSQLNVFFSKISLDKQAK